MAALRRWLGLRCRLKHCPHHVVHDGPESWVACVDCGKRSFRIWPREA